jgi:hypothetical protein
MVLHTNENNQPAARGVNLSVLYPETATKVKILYFGLHQLLDGLIQCRLYFTDTNRMSTGIGQTPLNQQLSEEVRLAPGPASPQALVPRRLKQRQKLPWRFQINS